MKHTSPFAPLQSQRIPARPSKFSNFAHPFFGIFRYFTHKLSTKALWATFNFGNVFGSTKYNKTKELILYIANKLAPKDTYGNTLLNKALYFIDNINYLKTGKPVSQLSYIKQTFGPTPDPSQLLAIRDELLADDEIELVEKEYFGRVQKRLIAKREADIELFTGAEIELIDNIVSSVSEFNGSEISDYSHQYPAWQAAADKEKLPFFTFLLSSKTPSSSDIEWAKSQLKSAQSH